MKTTLALSLSFVAALGAAGQTLTVDADSVVCGVEPLIYGACTEDVNHEIYGGLYDQKIFGEGFEEPAPVCIRGFRAYGEGWTAEGGTVRLTTARHGKLVAEGEPLGGEPAAHADTTGQRPAQHVVEVDVRCDDTDAIAGFIVNVAGAGEGADDFDGYEIALSARKRTLVVGKHQHDWQPIRDVPLPFAPQGVWHRLRVNVSGAALDVSIDGTPVTSYRDAERPLTSGSVGLRSFGGSASFRCLIIDGREVPFVSDSPGVSALWAPLGKGTYCVDDSQPFTGRQAQMMRGRAGTGIVNKGLNGWGIGVRRGERLTLSLYLRGPARRAYVALQSADGTRKYARTLIQGIGKEWKRFDTTLVPSASDPAARFCLVLGSRGTLWADQVLLCTDSHPFRDDLTQAFRNEHLTFLRYGGTMVNAREYLTRHMTGSRLERQPYRGHWYTYSTNGFAIPEFVAFARRIGAEPCFAINIEDNPDDVVALLREIEPYGLRYIEIGNEECIGSRAREGYEHYVERYLLLYEHIHRAYPALQFVNAAWWRPGERETMRYVFEALDGKCDFWDYHPWTETPLQALSAEQEIARMQALFHAWNPHTTMRCAILEENGNTHDMARALAHAVMLNVVRRTQGFVSLDSPANALQPYLQNDNGWDQGQIFFTPSQVWMQPPYYAQQMAAAYHQPLVVKSTLTTGNASGGRTPDDGSLAEAPAADSLDITATRNEAGDTLVLHIVNYGSRARTLALALPRFGSVGILRTLTLHGPAQGENTPQEPTRYIPRAVTPAEEALAQPTLTLEPFSYTLCLIAKGS